MNDRELEAIYQSKLMKKIEKLLPDSVTYKNDVRQGFPDLMVLNGNKWAMLEVKAYEGAPEQPNQRYYVEEEFGKMSYAAFVYPENEEEVLRDLQSALAP